MPVATTESLARELDLVGEVDLDAVFVHVDTNPLAHQPRWHRVRVLPNAHGAPFADAHFLLDVLRQLRDIELTHRGKVLGDAFAASAVAFPRVAVDERLPSIDALEVTTATHEQ